MRLATLICIADGEVDGDVETFDISTAEGKMVAINAWKDRIRKHWDTDSEHEVASRIEDGVIGDYSYTHDGYSFQLFWNELNGRRIRCVMSMGTITNYQDEYGHFKKISCIKEIRRITGEGLLEAKNFTEGSYLFLPSFQIEELAANGIRVNIV